MAETKNRRKPLLLALAAAAFLAPLVWISAVRMEGTPPQIRVPAEGFSVGASGDLTVDLADGQRGLRRVQVLLQKDGKESLLLEQRFPSTGFLGTGPREMSLRIPFDSRRLSISDGKGSIRISVRDHSWRRWLHGNLAVVEEEIRIDTLAPRIDVLTGQHAVSQGGSGLVAYRLSEPCTQTGVLVGDRFFPGASGLGEDTDLHLVLFALGHDQGPGTPVRVFAVDAAGNRTDAAFAHRINGRSFSRDVIVLSDGFLNRKMPEFEGLTGGAAKSPIERFLEVNRNLRGANDAALRQICSRSDSKVHWEGPFVALPNAAAMAGFAQTRDYTYQGKVVDRQVHLGVDLASTAMAPVPAANAGRVVFSDFLGIYGKTVVLDHGFGLFSMYSHLSGMDVRPGQMVAKSETIGRTGTTGLAGGDHLHFSMLVHHSFVTPLEWWDASWIRNHVSGKLKALMPEAGKG